MRRAAPWPFLLRRTLAAVALLSVAGAVLFLPFAGRFLAREDPLRKADLILVLAGERVERWLEAADLYKEGWAPAVVLSPGPVAAIEAELLARGITYPREGTLARDALLAAGLPPDAVTVLPDGVDNTAQEAAALKRMLHDVSNANVIVVTSRFHMRRAGFAFRREFRDTGIHVTVRGSRYSDSEPSRWWRQRRDIRYVMNELPKLLAYVAGLAE